jgi:hypothetical protein
MIENLNDYTDLLSIERLESKLRSFGIDPEENHPVRLRLTSPNLGREFSPRDVTVIQEFIESFCYNYTKLVFFPLKKKKDIGYIMRSAACIIDRSLPIQVLYLYRIYCNTTSQTQLVRILDISSSFNRLNDV